MKVSSGKMRQDTLGAKALRSRVPSLGLPTQVRRWEGGWPLLLSGSPNSSLPHLRHEREPDALRPTAGGAHLVE